MRTDWIGFEFEDKGIQWEVVDADAAIGEQNSYWWCVGGSEPDFVRVSWGERDLQIKFLEKEIAYEREQRSQFYKDIWETVKELSYERRSKGQMRC